MYVNLLPGYKFHYSPPFSGNFGGVAFYIRSDIKIDFHDTLELDRKNHRESKWISFQVGKRKVLLVLMYRHPNTSAKIFTKNLEESLSSAGLDKFDQCVLLGDMNIELLKFDNDKCSDTKAYLDRLLSMGFLPCTILPSRVKSHTATLIDHAFLKENKGDLEKISGSLLTDTSDHFASILIIKNNESHQYERPMS